eukprot:15858-Ditylum_brightwellii.AAC.3
MKISGDSSSKSHGSKGNGKEGKDNLKGEGKIKACQSVASNFEETQLFTRESNKFHWGQSLSVQIIQSLMNK